MTLKFYEEATHSSPYVAVYSNGQISISGGAVEKFGLSDWEFVTMGYDSDKKLVVIRKLREGEVGGLKISHKRRGVKGRKFPNAILSIWRIFEYFGIKVESIYGKRYELTRRDEDSLEFYLK